jgi:DMSO/TMAO reductase YedYZ heme-binding membrane subunit
MVQLSSLAMKRLPRRIWHRIHLTSYVTFWLTCLHGVLAGTDATNRLYLGSGAVAIFVTAFATAYRLLLRPREHQQPPQRPRPAAPSGWGPMPTAPPVGPDVGISRPVPRR